MKKSLLFVVILLITVVTLWAQPVPTGAQNILSTTPGTIPYSCNFEDPTENALWQLSNSTATNKWFIGTPSNVNPPISGGCLYISNDNGLTNAYTVTTAGVVVATRLIQFSGANEYTLNFDLIIGGESSIDYLKVYLIHVDTNYVGVAGSTYPYYGIAAFSLNQLLTNYNGTAPYFNGYNGSIIVPGSYPRQVVIPNQGPAGTVKKLVFVWRNDISVGTQPPAVIDNITIVENNCAMPSLLTASSPTQTSVNLAWTENGTATAWNVQYKLTSETNWTTVTATSNPFTVSSLTASSVYNFRVQADCGVEQSYWTNSITSTTSCGVISQFPWSEGFEATPWPAAVVPGNAGAPNCWLNINGAATTGLWRRATAAAYIRSGSGSAQQYSGGTTVLNNDYLITPQIALTGGERLRFWVKGNGTNVENINIRIYNVTTAGQDISSMADTSLFVTIMPNTTVNNANFTQYEVLLNQHIGNCRIAFVRNTTLGLYLNLDDIIIDAIPSCVNPILLPVSNITPTSAQINFTPANAADNQWLLFYKPNLSSVWDSIQINTNSYILQNLIANTLYDFKIKTDCGTEFSEGTGTTTFRTACDYISVLPWTDSFDTYGTGTTIFPLCWTRNTTVTDRPYVIATNFSPPGSLYFFAGAAGSYNIAATPEFASSIPVNTLKAEFKMRVSALDDTLFVGIMTDPTNASTFQLVSKVVCNAISVFEDKEVFLSNYVGTGQYIAFRAAFDLSASTIYIDNLEINTIPTCPRPTTVNVVSLLPNSVQLTWNESGTATTWEIEYGPTGFVLGTGTLIPSVTNYPYTISGLTPQTGYQFYVRAICSSTDISLWSNPRTATTLCAPISTLPWTDFFDTYGTGTTIFPACWIRNTNVSDRPYIISTNFSAPGSMYFYVSAAGQYNIASIPMFDATIPVNTLRANFKLRVSAADDTLYVGVMTNPMDASTFEQIGFCLPTATGVFQDMEISFNNYLGTGQFIAFKTHYIANINTIYLDNLSITQIPLCDKPLNLTASNLGITSATLNWTTASLGIDYTIEYKEASATSWTQILNVTPPYVLSSLTQNTNYVFRVQTNCAGSQVSEWSIENSFATLCTLITTIPYVEDFDLVSTGAVPACYNRILSGTAAIGVTTNTDGTVLNFSSGSTTNNCILVLPATDAQVNTIRMMFKYYGGVNHNFRIGYVTSPTNPNSFVELINRDLSMNQETGLWHIFDLATPNTLTGDERIAIKFVMASGFSGRIDSLTLVDMPPCVAPVALTATAITTTSADINWTPAGSGTPSGYNLDYRPIGSQTWNSLTNVFPPYALTTLSPSTIYQVRVQAICNSDVTNWSTTTVFSTLCGAITAVPWADSFDTYGTGTAAFPTCWTKTTSVSTYPYIITTAASAPGSLYFYVSAAGGYNIAVTPQFDISVPINTLKAEFKLRASGSDDTLYVGVMTTPTNEATFETVAKLLPSTTGVFQDVEVFFSNYTGTGQYIAFKSSYGATTSTIYVDNVVIKNIPSCPRPTLVVASNILGTQLDLGWSENGTATTWEIEYGPAGFVPGTGTLITSVSSNPYTITGLTPQTSYNFYVRSDCGGVFSEWSVISTFQTACGAISTLPWTDFFDTYGTGITIFPACWTRNTTVTDRPYVNATNFSAPGSLYFYAGTLGTYNIASTPMFDSSIQMNNLAISFKYRTTLATDTLFIGVMTDPTIASTFQQVGFVTAAATATWYDKEVFLTNYTGTGKYISFRIAHNGALKYAYIDNLEIYNIPACPRPTQLSISNPTPNSVNLNWLENGTATSWNIEYGPTGFTPGTGTTISGVTANPYLLSGLTPQTNYQFYVQSICGAGDLSVWSTVGSFMTSCSAITTLPWTDSFDTYGTGTAIFPTCWTRNSTVATNPNVSTVNNSAPGSLYFYMGTVGGYSTAVTPMFDASIPINTLKAEFKMRVSGLDDTMFVGVMTDPTNASTFQPVASIIPSSITVWHDMEVFFSNYTGTGQYIAFKAAYTATTVTIYLDNVQIFAIPNCPRPTQVSVSNVMSNSLNLNWIETGTATQWQVQYGPAGFALGTGTMINTSTNPLNIVSLNPLTSYDFYVRSICGVGDTSMWSVKTVGVTACVPITTLPWNEGFETISAAGQLPLCWSATNLGTMTNTQIVNSTTYNRVARTGTGAAYFRYGCNDRFFTPGFQLSAGVTYNFSYWYITDGLSGWSTLQLGAYSGQTAGTLVQTINTITSPIITTYTQVNAAFTPTTSGVFYFGVYCQANSTPWYITMDDFSLTGPTVTCPSPSNLTSSAITATSAQISWTAGGTETTWELDYKLASASTWTTVPVATNPTHLLNTLTPVSNYEVRVRAVCGASDLSAYSPIHAFTTTAIPCAVPTNLQVTNITDQAALATWTPGGSETSWQVEYKLVSSANWTSATTSTPSFTMAGLQSNSNYEVRVKAICTSNESAFTANVPFTTLTGTVTYTITATASTFGTITPSGAVSVNAGANQLFTFTPDNMYYVDAVVVDGVPIANPQPTYEFMNVQANHTIYVEFATWGIDENALAQFVELFPNPTTSFIELRLKADDLQVKECKVYDMYGKLMKVIPIHAETTSIDVTDFASGVYFVRMDSERGTISKKFVKK